ncbi:hypothetical protein GTP91_23490, partial [Rugamonas sp. FT82W]|nr:hypothetical protein [Duganella vulcania]
MKRRSLLRSMAVLPLMSLTALSPLSAWSATRAAPRRRVRPGDAGWP